MEYAEEFVSNNIENFTQVTEETVKSVAELAATQADIVAAELDLRPEVVPQLVKLAFYDFVILCGGYIFDVSDPLPMSRWSIEKMLIIILFIRRQLLNDLRPTAHPSSK